MKSANDIFREGCNLENYSPSLKVMNLAVWTATEYAAQKTKDLTKENERLKEQINSTGLVPEVDGKIYMQKRVKELCSRAYSDGYTDALAGNNLHPENWINGNI